jgi:pSer/pThr/pTyr-binding forkhead associated (FHA) protein
METVDNNQPQAKIVVKRAGVETEETFTFVSPAVIGRFDPSVGPIDIDLGNLPEGSYVSRKHAKLTCEDGIWRITDLGSSNGTYILRGDFERVEEGELVDGTEFSLGNARFVFRLAESAEETGEAPAQTEDPLEGEETNVEPSPDV